MTVQMYGIPNCDTIKKARKWLEAEGIEYDFHDYKKVGADSEKVAGWIADKGVAIVLNKRGTTFRKLSEEEKSAADDPENAAKLLVDNPSMIKRPVIEHAGGILVGFQPDEWASALR